MLRFCCTLFLLLFVVIGVHAQADTVLPWNGKNVTLSPVVIGKGLDVPLFIQRIKEDTTFYKAFKNLRVLGYTAVNDVRMVDKKNRLNALLHSTTKQLRIGNCRAMEILNEETTGDIYDEHKDWNYYTMAMYASLFFTKGKVCDETNLLRPDAFSLTGKSGLDKHKEQLKMLFFNPGKKIGGIPMVSSKTGIFDEQLMGHYDWSIDYEWFNGRNCIILTQKVRPSSVGQVVVDEMKTWLDDSTHEVLARNYRLSFDAGVYDFDVNMEVVMTHYNGLLVPAVIRYVGNWKVIFKRRERGIFTATLSDFNGPVN